MVLPLILKPKVGICSGALALFTSIGFVIPRSKTCGSAKVSLRLRTFAPGTANIYKLSYQKPPVSIRILSAKILRNVALFLLRFSKTQNRVSSNRYSNSNALQRDPYCRSLLAAIIKIPSFVSNAPDDGL